MLLFGDNSGSYLPGSPRGAGWNLEPALLLSFLLVSRLYVLGLTRVWRVGAGRGVAVWQASCFGFGIVVLFLVLVSPLDALSGNLSSAHMVQHMLMMNLAAPLVALGSPAIVVLNGIPFNYRRLVGRVWRRLDAATLRHPVVAWLVYAIGLWAWHLPTLYEAALRNPAVHDLQHVTFFASGFIFWRAVLDRSGRRLGPGVGLIYLFMTSLHATVLGVFMTLAPRPWYPGYDGKTEVWGLTPLEDQQLAGLIMWMPACLAYAIGAVGLLTAWLANEEYPAHA